MARLEDVLPALREGKKVRRKSWAPTNSVKEFLKRDYALGSVLADDWEIVPEPSRVADYLVEIADPTPLYHLPFTHWLKQTHPIGQQPEGSVMVPNSERDQE